MRMKLVPHGGTPYVRKTCCAGGDSLRQVNCPFFYKIGACRHGDRCSRQHHKPPFSQTILVQNLYQNPVSAVMAAGGDPAQLPADHVQDDVSHPSSSVLVGFLLFPCRVSEVIRGFP